MGRGCAPGWDRDDVVRRRVRRWCGVLAFTVTAVLSAAVPITAQSGSSRGSSTATPAPTASEVRRSQDGRFLFDVEQATTGIEVDGVLSEAAWGAAPIIPLPYETRPGDNDPAPVATECRVTYDDNRLYLGCRAHDPDPETIRAYVTDRDDIGTHDRVVFTIDPFNDARRAFQFGINPLGVQYDAVFASGGEDQGGGQGGADASWDAIWASTGRIDDTGYVVEAAIPFESLRFPSTDGVQSWGFYVTRFWPRSETVETRSMLWDQDRSCELCQANLLTGFTGIEPGANLEFAPTFTSTRTDSRASRSAATLETGELDPRFGLDARWGITTDIALNATVNPDFSQIEADVAQLDVNNRFALFFPEKRPFFLEGADLFDTPIQALFTRSIADPTFGTKLTGKSGARAFGLLVARDEVNNLLLPGDQGSSTASLDESVYTTSGRFRQDVGSSSNVGGLYVGREGEDGYYNRVAGADAFLRVLPALTARLQYLRSETRYAEDFATEHGQPGDAFGGNAVTAQLRYSTRNWFGGVNASHRDPGFRTDAGFTPQVDWRDLGGWVDRRFWADGRSWYTSFVVSGGFWHQENTAGELLQKGIWTNFQYNGPLQSSLWVNPSVGGEGLNGVEYGDLQRLWFGGSIRPTGSVGFRLNASVRDAADIVNQRLGRVKHVNPGLDLRLGRHIDLRLTQSWFDMNTPEGEDVFTAAVSQVRAVYNFSPRSFFRAIVQYRDTDRVPEVHLVEVDRSSSSLFTQLLFSYKVNPQTVLFLGFTDNRAGHVDTEFNEFGLTQLDRTFFLKLGYAFRP